MKAIQEWMGHSTFQFTADFYSHLEYNSKVTSANAIAQALGNGNTSKAKSKDANADCSVDDTKPSSGNNK